MNLWLELDNCLSVAQLVRALHRNRRAVGSIPARGNCKGTRLLCLLPF